MDYSYWEFPDMKKDVWPCKSLTRQENRRSLYDSRGPSWCNPFKKYNFSDSIRKATNFFGILYRGRRANVVGWLVFSYIYVLVCMYFI